MTHLTTPSSLTAMGTKIPRHVAIIMDGNGRWAEARGLPRFAGHTAGVEAVRRTVRAAIELGIQFLTIYSFSTENWSRPETEVTFLMGLMRRFIRSDLAELHKNGVRIRMLGERDRVDTDLLALMDEAVELTSGNTALTLVIAFNYGGRNEIAKAVKRLASQVADGTLPLEAITADTVTAALDTHGLPYQWRRTAIEFPALATCLCRILIPRCALARLRSAASGALTSGVQEPGPAIRRLDPVNGLMMNPENADLLVRAVVRKCGGVSGEMESNTSAHE
jgi:undecaprenyl diphosphate synthase